MKSSPRSWIGACAVSVALASCVTINIYFPAAAAERAADRIIDEIYGVKPGAKPSTEKSSQ